MMFYNEENMCTRHLSQCHIKGTVHWRFLCLGSLDLRSLHLNRTFSVINLE